MIDSSTLERQILANLRSFLRAKGYSNVDNSDDLVSLPLIANHIGKFISYIQKEYGIVYNSSDILKKSLMELTKEIANKYSRYVSTNFHSSSTTNLNNTTKSNTRHLNLVVVGRAGVGKSSFLNYAAGKNVFKTGLGDPVTQSYFDVINIEKPEKKVVYSLFDTKGLEAGNTEEWTKAIFSEIERRDQSHDIYEWFHTIIFCIDSSAKRIQPFEVKAIKQLKENNSVLVLLTKKDLVSSEILEGLKSQLKREIGDKVQVLSVCNVSTRTRRGESKASGLEDVLRVSFLGLWEKASVMLPYRAIKQMVEINQTLIVDQDLADLCALFTLLCWVTLDNGNQYKEIVDAWNIANYGQEDYYGLIGKEENIPFSYFKKVGELVDLKVWSINGKVQIDIRERPFPEIFNTPSQLDHEELDQWYYSSGVDTYLRLLNECFRTFIRGMKSRIGNLRANVGKDGTVIAEILKFYNDVNGTKQKPIFNHKTDEAITSLENTDFDKIESIFEKETSKVRSELRAVRDCVFFSSSERREAESKYKSFHERANSIIRNLEDNFKNFLSTYEAELHSYGQYCIREDEFAHPNDSMNQKSDKNDPIALLKKMIRTAMSDGMIGIKERMMLESMAEMHGISNSELDKLIIDVRDHRIQSGF